MELPLKNFKITTKTMESNQNRIVSQKFTPLKSKTPMKIVKTQAKSQTPNKNVRKITSVKPKFSLLSHEKIESGMLVQGKPIENQVVLPKINQNMNSETTNRVKTENLDEQ